MDLPHKNGKPREIQWTWQSRDTDIRVAYMSVDGRMSIAQLIEHLREVAPGVDIADIWINWSTVRWSRWANAEELAERQEAIDRSNARHEVWEREMWQKLQAKYGEASR